MGEDPFWLGKCSRLFPAFPGKLPRWVKGQYLCPYLDDIIVFIKTFEEQVEHIRQVLQRLQSHGVKLKPRKCKLFRREVHFLGRLCQKVDIDLT